MAGAAAEAGAAEKAAEILNFLQLFLGAAFCAVRSRDCEEAPAGCTHARKRLPGDGFAA
jgi:hypothetical protein